MREQEPYGIQRGWCEVERMANLIRRRRGEAPIVRKILPFGELPSGSLNEEDFERIVYSTLKEVEGGGDRGESAP